MHAPTQNDLLVVTWEVNSLKCWGSRMLARTHRNHRKQRVLQPNSVSDKKPLSEGLSEPRIRRKNMYCSWLLDKNFALPPRNSCCIRPHKHTCLWLSSWLGMSNEKVKQRMREEREREEREGIICEVTMSTSERARKGGRDGSYSQIDKYERTMEVRCGKEIKERERTWQINKEIWEKNK